MASERVKSFKKEIYTAIENSCRQMYRNNRNSLKIKNEELAVKNYMILAKATLKLCKEKGFQAMSIRDLSRETGLSLGALYYYFSNKDEIVRFVHEQGHHFIQELLNGKISGIEDPREKLHKAIEVHILLSEIAPDLFFFFFMETKNLEKEMRIIPMLSDIWVENVYADILNEGKKAGIYDFDNIDLIGAAIKSLLHDWYIKRWRYKQKKISVEQYIDFVISLIETYIRPDKHQV